ncbi:MAG: hypothetical protein J6R34_04290 [Clostridia bacterium]|nr:hypothetical protein [Clostridia bacterium]
MGRGRKQLIENFQKIAEKVVKFSCKIILFIIQYLRTAHFGGVLVVPQGSQIAEAEGGNKQILGGLKHGSYINEDLA